MKKCLITVQFGLVLVLGSGCVIVPAHGPHPRPMVVHRPPPPPRSPLMVVQTSRPVPPPVVVVETPRPPAIVVHPKPVVVHARTPSPQQTVVIINPTERDVIRQYVLSKRSNGHGNHHEQERNEGKHGKSLPKGLAKKVERGDPLPPGWQKRCVRGQRMPMEVFKHCEPLPHEILVKLPPPPAGTVIVTLEGKAVRLMQATLEILDVFDVI